MVCATRVRTRYRGLRLEIYNRCARAHTRALTHTRTHACTHARTRTHTHSLRCFPGRVLRAGSQVHRRREEIEEGLEGHDQNLGQDWIVVSSQSIL
jgi:hypothetical protein